nr:MAG: putative RNA-dependent RNA polymerase [Picobirnavirus sp.]
MKETKITAEMLEVVSNNNGLKQYLSGLEVGHEATPRSSLYNLEGKTAMLSPEQVLSAWSEVLKGLENGTAEEQKVFQFDSAQAEKYGPQGEVAPIKDLMQDVVEPTFSSHTRPKAFSSFEWELAKRRVVHMLWHGGAYALTPVSYKRVVDDMRARDTLISNSGWPLFTRRKKPEVIEQSIREAESGEWAKYPAIALFRNYRRKTRLVWMFPMSANLVEGSYFQPLQRALMNTQYANLQLFFSPWTGFEKVREFISHAYHSNCCVAASDFSSTDAHFGLDTTMEVYDVIKYCFQERYRAGLRSSLIHMHTIPLVVGLDTMVAGEHGVSSGSNWTNFIETIFDLILAEYVSIKEMTLKYGEPGSDEEWKDLDDALYFAEGQDVYAGLYAIGDDMSWFVDDDQYDPSFTDRLTEYGKDVGQVIKSEKTTNERTYVKSLQRLFQKGYLRPDKLVRAVYPTTRALNSLIFPEKFHSEKEGWTKDMEAVRAFMILENCVDHPLFEKFCAFVAAGDPNLKVVARMSSRRQNQLQERARSIRGLTTTYNQERRESKLSEFASVKVIRKL